MRNYSISSSFLKEISNLKKSELYQRKGEILRKSEILLQRRRENLTTSAHLIKILNKNFDLSNEKIYDVVLDVMIQGWHSPQSSLFLEILKTGNPFFKAWNERFSRSFDKDGIRVFDPKILPEFGVKLPRVYIQLMHCTAAVNKDFEKVDRIFRLYTSVATPNQDVYAKYLSLISKEFKNNIKIIKPKFNLVMKNFKLQIPVSEWTPKTATSVMKSILNISDFNSAISLYMELGKEQKKLELFIFLITFLVRFKYIKDAGIIVQDLKDSKLELTVLARICLLDYYSRARKSVEYKLLEKEMTTMAIPQKVWPRIWGIQIRAISLWDRVDASHAGKKILGLLHDIEAKGGVYDQFLLSTVVECLTSLGYHDKALEFLELANTKGVLVDIHTIHAILIGQLSCGYKHPEDVFELTTKYRILPTATTMNYILQILAKADSPKIRSFHEEMMQNDQPIYYLTKMDCVNSSINQNDYESFQYFLGLKTSPTKPQDYPIIAKGYCHFDKPEQMRIFWNTISSQKFPTEVYEYNMKCFMKNGSIRMKENSMKTYVDLIPAVWTGYYTQGKRSTQMCEMMMKYLLEYRSDHVGCMALFEESIGFPIPPSPQHMTYLLQSPILPIESKRRVFQGLKSLHYPTVDDYILMMKSERELEKLAELWEDYQSGDYIINDRVVEAIKPLTDQSDALKELVQLQLDLAKAT